MSGFVDYLRMIMGWWSGETAAPQGPDEPPVWVSIPGDRTWTSNPGNREWVERPGNRDWLSDK